jgi:putative oxidoreductase
MAKQQLRLLYAFTSLIFIYAGIKHLQQPQGIFKRIASSTFYTYLPNEAVFKYAILFSGAVMIAGGLSLLFGYKARSAAIVLLAMLVPITLTTQLENLNDLGPFFKNVAIAGSLLFIINRKKYEGKNNNFNNHHYTGQHHITGTENTGSEKRQPVVSAPSGRAYQPGN